MVWREEIAQLTAELELKRRPVAVRYEPETAVPDPAGPAESKTNACEAFLHASEGRSVRLTAADSSCALGPYFLRLGQPPTSDGRKAFEELLFDPERASCFIEEVPGAQAPTGHTLSPLGDSLVLSPLDTAEAAPDLVVFICTFEQACKLIALDCHGAGPPAKMEMRGLTCYRAITYPLTSGYLNVTLMTHASRRIHGYRADDLLVSVPVERFERMLRNLPRLTPEPVEVAIPDGLRSILRERCRGTDN